MMPSSPPASPSNPDSDLVLVLESQQDLEVGGVRRVTGFARLLRLLSLFDFIAGDSSAREKRGKEESAEKDAFRPNPRLARTGRITKEIDKTLREAPEQFPLRSKGILLGASEYAEGPAEGSGENAGWWRIKFRGPREGLADGGHTLLAIGVFLISRAMQARRQRDLPGESAGMREEKVAKSVRRIKNWSTFAPLWREHRKEMDDLARESASVPSVLSTLLPVEMLLPVDQEEKSSVSLFRRSLIGVSRSRNTSAQVQSSALINHAGLYEPLKKHLPAHVRENVEWVAGEGGRLKADEIVSIAFIAFNRIAEEGLIEVAVKPRDTYYQKATALRRYGELIRTSSSVQSRDSRPSINNPALESALKIVPDLLRLHDEVQEGLPKAYNDSGGRYGSLIRGKEEGAATGSRAKAMRYSSSGPAPRHVVPRGFMLPILHAFSALLDIKGKQLVWGMDPHVFLEKHFEEIARRFREGIVQADHSHGSAHPHQVGRNEKNYSLMFDRFRILRLEEESGKGKAP